MVTESLPAGWCLSALLKTNKMSKIVIITRIHTVASVTRITIRPWAVRVGQNYFASWHPCGKYLVCGLFERNKGILPLKKLN
jgi:hypothetical protein